MSLPEQIERIAPCTDIGDEHMHIAVYLLSDGDRHVLIDTGSVVDREEVFDRVDTALGGDSPDALLLSHTDLPHAGNFAAAHSNWPEADIWCGSNHPASHGLPDDTKTYDDSNTIAGRTIHFVDPVIKDRTNTTWIFDETTGVLFTSDGFGYHHAPDECAMTLDALIDGDRYDIERVYQFHRTSLPWLRYADVELLRSEIAAIREAHDLEFIAPSHGPIISSDHIDSYLDDFFTVVDRMGTEYADHRAGRQVA